MSTTIGLHCIKKYLGPDNCFLTPSLDSTLGCPCVILEEPKNAGKSGTLEKLRLKYVEPNIVFYAIDEALEKPYPDLKTDIKYPKVFSNILNTKMPDSQKPCDFIFFLHAHNTLNVILCELKSTNVKGYKSKFIATKCFIEYVRLLINHFEGQIPSCCEKDFMYQKILVRLSRELTARTLNKNGTYPSRQIDKGLVRRVISIFLL